MNLLLPIVIAGEQLVMQDVERSDEGAYMCQINTDPMKSQVQSLNRAASLSSLLFSLFKYSNFDGARQLFHFPTSVVLCFSNEQS